MSIHPDLEIRALDKHHDKSSFNSGSISLDNYIKKQANQDTKRRISRVFAATTVNQADVIVGYYTLSSLSIELNQLPPNLAHKLPRYPIPAALIGRLAIDQSFQGQGVGKLLLVDAIKRTLAVSNEIAIYAIVVDAIDKAAEQFYMKFGFMKISSENRRLFLPLKNLQS